MALSAYYALSHTDVWEYMNINCQIGGECKRLSISRFIGNIHSSLYFPSAFKIFFFSPKNNLGNMKQKAQ